MRERKKNKKPKSPKEKKKKMKDEAEENGWLAGCGAAPIRNFREWETVFRLDNQIILSVSYIRFYPFLYPNCIRGVLDTYPYEPKLKISTFTLQYVWDTFVPVWLGTGTCPICYIDAS